MPYQIKLSNSHLPLWVRPSLWDKILVLKSIIFWDIMMWGPFKFSRHFGGTCCLYSQDQRINKQESRVKQVASRTYPTNNFWLARKPLFCLYPLCSYIWSGSHVTRCKTSVSWSMWSTPINQPRATRQFGLWLDTPFSHSTSPGTTYSLQLIISWFLLNWYEIE